MIKAAILLSLVFTLTACTSSNSAPQAFESMPPSPSVPSEAESFSPIAASAPVLLAGTTSQYYEFSQAEFNKAVDDHKVIYLEFYATWCPTCKAQEPSILAAFQKLTDPNLTGFRVNYNDNFTDLDEKALSERYNVTYQHTKVILHDGEVLFNKNEIWNEQTALKKLSQYRDVHGH